MELGQPFNPYRLFHGVFLPEALLGWPGLEPGAKLCYGRLSRYAGKAGECWPAASTLAQELGVTVRQTRRYLSGLEEAQFIRRDPRPGYTNRYVFLWHRIFALSSEPPPDDSGEGGRTDMSGGGGQICPTRCSEESQRIRVTPSSTDEGRVAKDILVRLYRQHVGVDPTGPMVQGIVTRVEEKGIDLAGWVQGIQGRLKGRRKAMSPTWFFQQIDRERSRMPGRTGWTLLHDRVRAHLVGYMRGDSQARVAAPDREIVERCVAALNGHTVEELEALLRDRFRAGCRRGLPGGPRGYAWFEKVIANHFATAGGTV